SAFVNRQNRFKVISSDLSDMQFILNLTLREVRSSWRRLLFFFICIGIGVGSIVALRSVIQNLNRAVASEARSLLTADVEINTTAPFTEVETAAIAQVAANNANIIEARNQTIQTNTMSRPSDDSKSGSLMLELKGVERGFPLVGDFRLSDDQQFDFSLLENKGAVVAPLVLERLNLKIGDKIRIGNQDFEIRAQFTKEPGGTTGFRLGPRVFIEKSGYDAAGLDVFGSRNRRRILFRADKPENAEPLAAEFRAALKGAKSLAVARSYKESQDNLKNSFDRAENFLSLTGLVILVLGGIGVWNVTRVFVEQKKSAIAVLKCLGATGTRVTLVYLLQILILGALGSLLGIALAQLALFAIRQNFAESLPVQMSYNLQPGAILQGILLGLAVSMLFSLLPLLQIRNIKPRLILRDNAGETFKRFSVVNLLVGGFVISGLVLLAVWQANSWRIGIYFLFGLAGTAAVLYAGAFVLTAVLRRFRAIPIFAVRQAINSLHRPGNQTRVVLLAVGLGVFVVLSVQLLQSNLQREFDLFREGSLPTLFLIDIRRAQAADVKNLISEQTGETVEYIPAVRGRIAAINGQPFDSEQREINRQSGQIGREYVLTYRSKLVGEEEIVDGQFWDETSLSPKDEGEVSLDESMKDQLKLNVGDNLTFDIFGQKRTARIVSFRRLDVRNPRSTFQIVFRPGTLEEAPQTLLAPIYAPLDAAARSKLQRALVDKFPNISAIDTADAVAAIKRLLDNITLAVSFVGGFVFLSGALILIGSIALTKFQRVYENAILKTLGARRGTLLVILLTEYGLLGILAAIVGVSAAVTLSYFVANYVFQITWRFNVNLTLLGFIITTLLVMIVGAVSSFDVLLRKPLATLRSQ
ncbi:MAG: FtsX-like permease family protein, partial [Pyrinomonadaceae bacterium]